MSNEMQYEKERLPKYEEFCRRYGIEELEKVVDLYDVDELMSFVPAKPTQLEAQVMRELIGVRGQSGYMDYRKSNNTFELIMQWQEKTHNHDLNAMSFVKREEHGGEEEDDQ